MVNKPNNDWLRKLIDDSLPYVQGLCSDGAYVEDNVEAKGSVAHDRKPFYTDAKSMIGYTGGVRGVPGGRHRVVAWMTDRRGGTKKLEHWSLGRIVR